MPTPHPERPRYRLLADELRRRIAAGVIPRGALLPSETAMIAEFGSSRGTVREAIRLLREEGLVVTEHGRGTLVRPEPPVRRRGSDRYRWELTQLTGSGEPMTSFTVDHGIDWSDFRLDREFAEVPASSALADLFAAAPGTMLLERRFVFFSHNVPQQMAVSYYPLALVAGTPVADPDNEPWPGGNIAQLHTLGVTVTSIRELVRARMPVPDEVETLRMPAAVPVVTITRQTYAGEAVVEAAVDIVIPADRVELDYRIDLTG